ncbi:cysteine-rich receptor-like protein kinase 3 [Amborella trichopoda]|uniref:Protein kinase domain-containing protein n=1 Tax=Amborella trichopoda TaxID=13333 RepID=W1P482_AMBTC|nr:cysteine-rich receptor-like protein kinase 3 [Amborella trichopoda]ERN02723.1 hypothetical protein AMTR_s00085p00155370 [Amborella trichopoda]|eukprot:XP_011622089.2 cysteine-rich receptor-like protein kinase 3 [Amborella trichopoda]
MAHPTLFYLLTLFTTFIIFFFSSANSDPRITQAAIICGNKTALDRPAFTRNFLSALDSLTQQIANQRYATVVQGSNPSTVYAFGQCMNDLSQTDCQLCFSECKTEIYKCVPFQKGTTRGRTFLDGCYLRYDTYDFFHEILDSEDKVVCNGSRFNGSERSFVRNSLGLMKNLSAGATGGDGFKVGFVERENTSVYGLVQCWKPLNMSSCGRCLDSGVVSLSTCLPLVEGRVLNSGCYLRYSTRPFYNVNTSSVASTKGHRRFPVILAIVSCSCAVFMLLVLGFIKGKNKLEKRRREQKQLGQLAATVNKSKLNFKYEMLEEATDYFDNSNKLGQGGNGSVYKGILPNGQVVAIKRLFFNTRQWVDEFFNEVNLISDVQHKNLVKLLGCSITGPESLLVYEYVPNKSLDNFLFDNGNSPKLSWNTRCEIIVGVAEGLAYLHEESKLRIIHRDIKLSNILLDENFNAKIADFGLARCFPQDKTHISTGIAGTLGYMAPEYIIRGKLTEKADVYSFGVLIVEILSGRRVNSYSQTTGPVLQVVWDLYRSCRLYEAVDPSLEGGYSREDVSRVLQIGLLCTQASAELRPSMALVVQMLKDTNCNIPLPTQPPFINTGLLDQDIPSTQSGSSGNSRTVSFIGPR